jgi:hypothetical protein
MLPYFAEPANADRIGRREGISIETATLRKMG